MSLWICGDCSAAYAVGLSACPQCGSASYEEDSVKISKASGVTYGTGDATVPPEDDSTEAAVVTPVPVADQLAAGIPKEETVTIADQKAGAEPPPLAKAPRPKPSPQAGD